MMDLLSPSSRRLAALAFAWLSLVGLAQAATITSASTFTPADAARDGASPYMDRGGVWNGTTEVTATTGDTFALTIANTGSTAYDLAPQVTLPAGFSYVSGTVSVSGGPSAINASVVGSVVIFSLDSGEFDLTNGSSVTIEFGLVAADSVVAGTYQLSYEWEYGDNETDLTPTLENTQQNVLVQAGDTVLSVTPATQTRGIGETASWTVTVMNSGLAGLFDVEVDESALVGNASFSGISITQASPALPVAAETAPGSGVYVLPYLGVGESLTFTVEAVVAACSNLGNTVVSDDRTGLSNQSKDAPIQLDLDLPFISFSGANIALDYLVPTSVSVAISNVAGAGPAVGFVLDTNLNELPVTISNVGAAFSYNASNGEFTLVAGDVAASASVNLTFDVVDNDVCAGTASGTISWQAFYENECGDAYAVPLDFSSLSAPTGQPSISVGADDGGLSRLANGESGTFTITASATELARIATDPAIIAITTAGGVTITGTGTPTAGSLVDNGGGSYTWTVAKASLSSAQTVEIDFVVNSDPCLGGTDAQVGASVAMESIVTASGSACPLASSDSDSFTITNNPGAFANQFFDVDVGSPFEAGSSTADGVRDDGEGEFIGVTAIYSFGAAYPGEWAGSTFEDDFGNLTTQTIVPGSVQLDYDNGTISGTMAVPSGSITQATGSLAIDWGFLATVFGDNEVGGTTITLTYQTTIPDAEISGNSQSVRHKGVFDLANATGAAGACDLVSQSRFTQVSSYTVEKARPTFGVSVPSILDVCEEFDAVISLGNANSQSISRVLITLNTANTDYAIVGNPTFGGSFVSGDFNYTPGDTTNPTFTYAPSGDDAADMVAGGTITIPMRRTAESGTDSSAVSVSVAYDDNETHPTSSRDLSADASGAPSLVLTAHLEATVTPDTRLQVNDSEAQWTVVVQNTQPGVAYEATLVDELPEGFEIDLSATAAANGIAVGDIGVSISGGRETVTFDLGDMLGGASISRVFIANITSSASCSVADGSNMVTAYWGCGGDDAETVVRLAPNFGFGRGALQVVHDTSNSVARLCGPGEVRIKIKNTGEGVLNDVVVTEMMVLATTGLSIIPGTIEFSTDNAPSSFSSISGTAPTSSPFVFDSSHIAALGNLVSVADDTGSTVNEVTLKFQIEAALPNVFVGNDPGPSMSATGSATLFCGNAVSSPGVPFTIDVVKPDIDTTLLIDNTGLAGGFGVSDVGATGQAVQWQFTIDNNGDGEAENVRVRIPLSGSGGSATISGPGLSGAYAGGWVAISDIAALGTAVVTVTETLGGTCVNATQTAEVTWGCSDPGATSPNEVTLPSDNSDSATILMSPEFDDYGGSLTASYSQSLTSGYGQDGRSRVLVTMENGGAQANSISVTVNLPANVILDTTFAPVFSTNNSALTAVTWDSVSTEDPVFDLTGTVENGEDFTIEFFVISSIDDATRASSFPDLVTEEETGNSLDPSTSLGGSATFLAEFKNSCGIDLSHSIASTIDPRQPELDINLAAGNGTVADTVIDRVVLAGTEETFDFYVRNEGESSSSAAGTTLTVSLGAGWGSVSIEMVDTPRGSDGVVVNANSAIFTPAQIDEIRQNEEVHLRVRATPTGVASDSLAIQLDVDAQQLAQDGTPTGRYVSRDSRAYRCLGVSVEKVYVNASTTEAATTNERDTLIGEEAAFDLTVGFFGAAAGANVSSIVVRDSLGNDGVANKGLGLVSIDTASSEMTVSSTTTTPAGLDTSDPVANGVIEFALADLGSPLNDLSNEFKARIVARTLNDADTSAVNTDNKQLFNNLGLSFAYQGTTFHSNDTNDNFSGGTAVEGLHDSDYVRVQRPTLSIDKTVRNLSRNPTGAFGDTAAGEATDIFEFKLVITNTDSSAVKVPLYDLFLDETISTKLSLLSGATSPAFAPGADTNGDDAVDVIMTGGVTAGAGGRLEINATTLPIGSAGEDFVQLDAGSSIILLYRAEVVLGVAPSETVTDSVAVSADTLPGASGSQSARAGETDDDDGAAVVSASDDPGVTVTVDPITQSKELVTTSVGGDTATNVLIGEQAEFRVTFVLPQGVSPSLSVTDALPGGLALVAMDAPVLGTSVAPTNSPATIVPDSGTLPASGTPLNLSWDFGDTTVTSGTDEERSITITYLTQVRNIDGLDNGDTLTNSAGYQFSGSPVDITDVTLSVIEAELSLTKSVSPATVVDAGDTLTYTVSIENESGAANAYDVNIVDTLPDGVSYVAESLTVLSGVGETTGLTGTLGEPDVTAGVLTWGREQSTPANLDLGPGGRLVFTYEVTLDDSVEPDQTLTNRATVDWTSLDGSPGPDSGTALDDAGETLGERTGSGTAPNSLTDFDETTSAVAKTASLTKSASGDTLPLSAPADGFRVGDMVTYTIEVTVMEGTHEQLRIVDTLPSGLAFVDFEPVTPASGADVLSYTALVGGSTAPSADDTGTLVFNLGDVVNEGDNNAANDTLTLVYRARVMDAAATADPDGSSGTADTDRTVTNSALLRYLEADDDVFDSDDSSDSIVIRQPELTMTKTRLLPVADNRLAAGDSGQFRLTVENVGTAPAYNAEVLDTLPEGLREVTPTLLSAILGGTNIAGAISPGYASGSGEWTVSLSDVQVLLPGETLVLDYQFTVDTSALAGETLTNSADVPAHYSKPASDTTERRVFDNVTPDSENIEVLLTVQGTVFEDANVNRALNAGEDWTGGRTVYVNLVESSAVVASDRVDAGTGAFRFDDVAAGNYTLVVSNSATNPLAASPPDWVFYETAPTDGSLSLTVTDSSLFGQDFALIQGSFLSGVVFEDNGAGGGTANDGLRNGSEAGLPDVRIRLTDCASIVYATGHTGGDGAFTLVVPVAVANNATLCVEEFTPAGYRSSGGDAGTTGGTYDRDDDTITFVHEIGASREDLSFADVPPNAFLTDGEQAILPGSVAFYTHSFIAGTGGEVSFALSNTLSPDTPGWGQSLFRDTNGNGQLDAGEPLLDDPSTPITVAAGDEVALIVKDSSPAGAPFGAQDQITITATFVYTNASPALSDEVFTRIDLTRIGPATTSGLELLKAVDQSSAKPGDSVTYTLTYTNNGIGDLRDIVIHDVTPAFTTFVSAASGTYPEALTAVTITDPGAGGTGAIVWTFTGTLAPGSTGTVTYIVRIVTD